MLNKIKLALRISGNDFDDEIQDLIDACLDELEGLGIYYGTFHAQDKQIYTAVVAYCKWHFGDSDTAEKWEHIYYDVVSKLQVRSGYGLSEGDCNG